MGGYILREEEKNIVLPLDAVERLITAGNGDAALLYLELQRIDTGVTAQRLMQRLRWSQLRLNAAESELQRMGLLPSGAGLVFRVLGRDTESVQGRMRGFRSLVREAVLGRPLPPEFLWR